jgi:hypothetical protein
MMRLLASAAFTTLLYIHALKVKAAFMGHGNLNTQSITKNIRSKITITKNY